MGFNWLKRSEWLGSGRVIQEWGTKGSSVLLDIPKRDQSDESDEVFLSKLWSMESTIFILHQQSASHMKGVMSSVHLRP